MSKVYFSIGSNKGNRSKLINEAIDKIDISIGRVEKNQAFMKQSHGVSIQTIFIIPVY